MAAEDMFQKLPEYHILPIADLPKHAKRDYFNFFEGCKYIDALNKYSETEILPQSRLGRLQTIVQKAV